MSRSTPWRRSVTDSLSWYQDQALSTNIYILRDYGPTGFLLKEDDNPKTVKVYLGDPHRCSCKVYNNERELCKHLCWVLLKKFKIPRTNPVSWQLGLVEREINEVLKSFNSSPAVNAGTAASERDQSSDNGDDPSVESNQVIDKKQRNIDNEDICPICQENFLEKRQNVTFCKQACGSNVHVVCMKIWAEHQRSQTSSAPNYGTASRVTLDDAVSCPMCRGHFGSYRELLSEYAAIPRRKVARSSDSPWFTCRECRAECSGACFRCSECSQASPLTCSNCLDTRSGSHSDKHLFQTRNKPNQNWKFFKPSTNYTNIDEKSVFEIFPKPTNEALMSLHKEQLRKGHRLLGGQTKGAQQCKLCLHYYNEGDMISKLPECLHRFHVTCLNQWLINEKPCCPIDGAVFSSKHFTIKNQRKSSKCSSAKAGVKKSTSSSSSINTKGDVVNFIMPGFGISSRPNDTSANFTSQMTKAMSAVKIRTAESPMIRRTNSSNSFLSSSPLPAIGNPQTSPHFNIGISCAETNTHPKPKPQQNKRRITKAGRAAIRRETLSVLEPSCFSVARGNSGSTEVNQNGNKTQQWAQQNNNNDSIVMVGSACNDNVR